MKKYFLFVAFFVFFISQAAANGFTGYFAPANWTVSLPESQYGGSVSHEQNYLTINGPDGDLCLGGKEVAVSIAMPDNGVVWFRWDYISYDEDGPTFDVFIIRKTVTGTEHILEFIDYNGFGVFSGAFDEGDELSFVVSSQDCILGEGVVTITGFQFIEDPVVPLANWAIFLSLALITLFVIFHLRPARI